MIHDSNNTPVLFTSRGLNSPVGRKLISHHIHPHKTDTALLISIDEYYVGDILKKACTDMGFEKECITLCETKEDVKNLLDMNPIPQFSFIYIGEGNTYQILDLLTVDSDGNYSNRFLDFIRREHENGAIYCGSSAGAAIAGVDIKLLSDYAEKELNFCQIDNLTGINIFPGVLIPHYTEEDFIRFFYKKSLPEIEVIKNHYEQIGNINDESIFVWDPEKTLHLLEAFYNDVNNIDGLAFFLEVASNTGATLFVYDGIGNDVKKITQIKKVLDSTPGLITFEEDSSWKIPEFDIPVYNTYHLRNHIYGFRLKYQEKRFDIMVCK